MAARVYPSSPYACLYQHATLCHSDELVYPVSLAGASLVHFAFLVPGMLAVGGVDGLEEKI